MKTMLSLASFLLLFGIMSASDQAFSQHPDFVSDQAVSSSGTIDSYDCAQDDAPEVYITKKERRAQCKARCRQQLMDRGLREDQPSYLGHLKNCVGRCMQGAES
jgi:hypothetical protein